MWLAKRACSQEADNTPSLAKTICATTGEQFLVGESEYREVPVCAPYGIYSRPPQGRDVIVLSAPQGEVALGIVGASLPEMKPGELILRSAGGAEIYLRNDGKVIINGKEV